MAVFVTDRVSEDNKYLHRDFHLIFNRGLDHIAGAYGEKGVEDYMRAYARNYFSAMTLDEIAKYLTDVYEREEASDDLELSLSDKELSVKVVKCPAVTYIRSKGDEPSKYYIHSSKTLYEEIALISGLKFEYKFYDEATGACEFTFKKPCRRCCKKKEA